MSSTKRLIVGLISVFGMVIATIALFASAAGAESSSGAASPGDPYPSTSISSSGTESSSSSSSSSASSSTSTTTSESSSGTSTTTTTTGSSSSAPVGDCTTNSATSSSVDVNCSGFAGETTLCVGTSPGDDNLGTGKTNADGEFNGSIPTKDVNDGDTVYVGKCNGTAAESASVKIDLGGSGGGNLSNTGVAVVGIGALGLVLLVGGGMLLLAGRRRGGAHA